MDLAIDKIPEPCQFSPLYTGARIILIAFFPDLTEDQAHGGPLALIADHVVQGLPIHLLIFRDFEFQIFTTRLN